MKSAHWVILIAWWVYVAEPAAAQDAYGRVYPTVRWVAKERFLYRDFCEGRAKEFRRQGLQAVCQYLDD